MRVYVCLCACVCVASSAAINAGCTSSLASRETRAHDGGTKLTQQVPVRGPAPLRPGVLQGWKRTGSGPPVGPEPVEFS